MNTEGRPPRALVGTVLCVRSVEMIDRAERQRAPVIGLFTYAGGSPAVIGIARPHMGGMGGAWSAADAAGLPPDEGHIGRILDPWPPLPSGDGSWEGRSGFALRLTIARDHPLCGAYPLGGYRHGEPGARWGRGLGAPPRLPDRGGIFGVHLGAGRFEEDLLAADLDPVADGIEP